MAYNNIQKEDLHLVKRIGIGGFSCVFQATVHGQEVAAKRLNEPDQHEVEVLATLDHPHIVKLIGIVRDKLDLYLVLELCRGGSLRSYLDQKRSENKLLPVYQVYNWAKQAARPIQYLQQRNLVHKDIKSPNYLIADGNVLKLADFGIAKNIESTIQNATQRASPAWGAPELFKDNILSPSYDISAYGVVVWEMCTTLVPFEGSDNNHIIWRICHNNERPAIPPDCPKPLADLMLQCWEVNWHKRPNADHILKVLSSAERELKKRFIAGPWELEKEFGHQVPGKLSKVEHVGIAINPTSQDVAVMDTQGGKVMIYCNTGEFKSSSDTTQGLLPGETSHPLNVAVSSEGNYYITDSTQFVKCYNQYGVYKTKWVAVSPEHKPADSKDTELVGLAIDHTNNLLLVGVVKHKYISKHHLDGNHVKSIKINIQPCFLSVTSQGTIIISDNVAKIAQIVDKTGQVLHTLKPPSQVINWYPIGICCHEGIIFICNNTSQQVCCFSESGEYIGYIPVTRHPWGLTFVPGQKKFLVTVVDRVQVYSCAQ